jgi:hypothetical protein
MNHDQIAEAADQFLLIGFDLHLRRLLFRHFPSVGLRFKLTQMLESKHCSKNWNRHRSECDLRSARAFLATLPDNLY